MRHTQGFTIDRGETSATTQKWGLRVGGEGGAVFNYADRYEAEENQRTVTVATTACEVVEPCVYTHAHTRHWCGNPHCRDS